MLTAIATEADKLATAGNDIGATRLQFGELSRQVLRLVAITPELQTGRHVFECPMAPGFKKWLQVSQQLENPYFGKSMLTCGVPSTYDT